MKKMKSLIAVALCVMMLACLAGCGSDKNGQAESGGGSQSGAGSTQTSDKTAAGYTVKLNGTTLGVDMDMEEALDGLGEPKSDPYEAPSCAGQGTAYIYDYGAFTIETYPEDGKNLIGFITLKDDTVATSEGVDLSMTKEDIVSAYGDDYTKKDNGLTYEKDGMKLNFILDGDTITSIEYTSSVVG